MIWLEISIIPLITQLNSPSLSLLPHHQEVSVASLQTLPLVLRVLSFLQLLEQPVVRMSLSVQMALLAYP